MNTAEAPARLAVLCDFPEEGWPSMDLTGEMILASLARGHAGDVSATRVCPPFRRRVSRLPVVGSRPAAWNADRLLNRMRDYPRFVGRLSRRGAFDLYHVVDHSYAQLVHAVPAGRGVVTCHDLDTFRCLLEPAREPRPAWFRAMAGRILEGLKKAAAVVCNSEATRDGLLSHGLVDADRLHVVYLGISPEFSPEPDPAADAEAARLLGPIDPDAPPDLLHVGSNIPRKRVDVLLAVLASVRRARPGVRLIKAGGGRSPELERLARDLGVADAVVTLPFLADRAVLAAVYRRASLVLLPSESEGFGLPAAEALACGAPLLASDLPTLREAAGDAGLYRTVGDVPSWTEAALSLLDERRHRPGSALARRAAGFARARTFSWATHADRLVSIYRDVLARPPAAARSV